VALVRKIRFERIPPAVSRHAALRRPDFPRALPVAGNARGCLSGGSVFSVPLLDGVDFRQAPGVAFFGGEAGVEESMG
jgi:hypothetical protein